MSGEMTRQRLQEALGLKHEDHFREAYLTPALRAGLIEMTIPGQAAQQQTALSPDSGGARIPEAGQGITVSGENRDQQDRAGLVR